MPTYRMWHDENEAWMKTRGFDEIVADVTHDSAHPPSNAPEIFKVEKV